jgi:hypothetical protein
MNLDNPSSRKAPKGDDLFPDDGRGSSAYFGEIGQTAVNARGYSRQRGRDGAGFDGRLLRTKAKRGPIYVSAKRTQFSSTTKRHLTKRATRRYAIENGAEYLGSFSKTNPILGGIWWVWRAKRGDTKAFLSGSFGRCGHDGAQKRIRGKRSLPIQATSKPACYLGGVRLGFWR